MKNDLDIDLDVFLKSSVAESAEFTNKVMLLLPPQPKPFYLTVEGFLSLVVLCVGCWKFSFWLPKAFSEFWVKTELIKTTLAADLSVEIAPSICIVFILMMGLFLSQKLREAF